MNLSDTVLTLLFTSNVSLKNWAEVGNLERELEIYKRLGKHLKQVNFVTYGGHYDWSFAQQIKPINLLPIRWYGPGKKTARRLLLLYGHALLKTSVFKTNQIRGSGVAVWLKNLLHKKLVVRCGYLHSKFIEAETKDKQLIRAAHDLERRAFEEANIGIVTSESDRQWVIEKHKITPDKIRVIPNYVNTDIFQPMNGMHKRFDLVCVAKAHPQKNLGSLLDALSRLKQDKRMVRLLLIGGCSEDESLRKKAQEHRLDVTFKGNVTNYELPRYMSQAKVFVIPSYFEGHPKTLLEAMSCGMPCIGSNVEGIRENIKHRETGYLCKCDPEGIANAIKVVMDDEACQHSIGKKARQYIVENYSVEQILKLEQDVLTQVTSH